MSIGKSLSRRRLLRIGALGGVGAAALALAACGETQIVEVEKIVEREVVVEKVVVKEVPVEKVVEKIVPRDVVVEVIKEVPVEKVVIKEVEKVVEKVVERIVEVPASGTVTIASSNDLDNYDPHVQQLLMSISMMKLTMFNSLVTYSPNLDIIPDLALSWESPDDQTFIFALRRGVLFHNGREFVAEDVKNSLERVIALGTVWASRMTNVGSVDVLDTYTVRINLTAPQADFLDAMVGISMIPAEAGDTMASKPVGTGPYKFVEWVANDRLVLVRNEDYYDETLPRSREIIWRIIPEPQVAVTNLLAGDVDAILDVPLSVASQFEGSADPVVKIPASSGSFHLFEIVGKNATELQDPRVRQAIAHALDKAAINSIVFFGQGTQKWTPVPSGTYYFADQPGFDFNLDRARELLAEAGVPDGFEFSIIVPGGFPDGEREATIWQEALGKIGITLNIEVQELSQWLDNYIGHNYDVTWNVFPGFADPNYFFGLGLRPHLEDPDAWNNAEAAELLETGANTLDRSKRRELYARLQEIVATELPIIAVQEAPNVSLIRPNVRGWEMNAVNWVNIPKVWVE